MEPYDVLAGLDPEQRDVAEAVRGPVCVLAGAGTGKTRAITHRIAHAVRSGVVDAQGVLAVTFTTRAAGELRQRLRQLGTPGVQARTFHAAALRQLTYFWPRVIGGDPPRVIESKMPLLIDACRSIRKNPDRSELRDIAAEIEWAKVTQIAPEDYADAAKKAGRTPPVAPEEVFRLYDAYETLRRDRHLVDFETILELTSAVMTEHREVAAQIREQYRYFVVDEYQDVNPLQKLLLDTWLGGRDDLCVVGDPNQTIYSFTGATPRYLTGFSVEHPNATVIKLVRDYRSTPQVVSLANRVLEKARTPHKLSLIAQRPDGPEPVFAEYDDEVAEAEGVARAVKKLADGGVPTREIAVLFRVNAQSEAYEQALGKAGVPYVLRGADRFFERPEVRQAVVLLRGAARSVEPDDTLVTTVHHILAGIGLTPVVPGGGKAREKWESLKALADLAEDLAAEGADLPAFVTELERRASEQHAPPVEGVTLASLHAAKGLEWDAVFLVGVTDGMLPIIYAETPEQIEEERRLLYVGVTRARAHLGLSWALARSPGGRRSRRPSRFLDGLTGRSGAQSRTPESAPKERRAVAAPVSCRICARTLTSAAAQKLGRCPTCPVDYDEALLEALKSWRTGVGKKDKIPQWAVFTDVTLQAIAERAPASEQDLLAIAGIGRVKLDRYGEAVLDLCRTAANQTEDA
ncbi:ATP-dependent DNA helicase UvrD2 [Streptosporangium sp. 'caverna']|uniref:ATP-dependent DNA helicase UvrD2 n=1 Tax=Streptosporangium sp. 'caverna' TaxID=2202249 RepID=UPI000D7E7EBC|nr:ATP-dependent DNA helicase UvrD2 [Streptosporangium sp. 'caverna']AWS46644.1 ATP-dependent DNA helicase [Streptosporangium sp. 'caverna']